MSYKFIRKCRILEEKYMQRNFVLSGNMIIEASIRNGELSNWELEYVDRFMAHVELLNHSGIYKGYVGPTYFFFDNEHGSVGIDIEYVLSKDVSMDIDECKLREFLQWEFDGVGVSICEISYKVKEYRY